MVHGANSAFQTALQFALGDLFVGFTGLLAALAGTGLPRLSWLAGLVLFLAGIAGLVLGCLLRLLALAARQLLALLLQLLQALLQFLGLPAQHFLLVALCFRKLLLVAQVVGKLLLAAGQFIQLLHDVFFFRLLGLRRCIGAGLVLVQLQVHFQFEHFRQVLLGAAATTAATTLLVGDLEFVEHGFGTQ